MALLLDGAIAQLYMYVESSQNPDWRNYVAFIPIDKSPKFKHFSQVTRK